MKIVSKLILAVSVAGLFSSAAAFADEAPNSVTGVVRAVSGASLTLATRNGELLVVDQTDALARHMVAPGVKAGVPVTVTGVRSANTLRAASVTRAKPAVGNWAVDH